MDENSPLSSPLPPASKPEPSSGSAASAASAPTPAPPRQAVPGGETGDPGGKPASKANVLLGFFRDVGAFYWSQRAGLKAYLLEYILDARFSGNRQREIRITPDNTSDAAELTEWGWDVKLPDCCVVCGEPTKRDWSAQTERFENLKGAFWLPIVTTLCATVLAVFFWNKWIILLGPLAGMLLGYLSRSQTKVKLRFRRCQKDADNKRFPHTRCFSNLLIVGVGSSIVRQKWIQERHGNLEIVVPVDIAHPDESTAPEAAPWGTPTAEPEPIQMAEEVHSTVQIDEPPRMFERSGSGGSDLFSSEGTWNSESALKPTTGPQPLQPFSANELVIQPNPDATTVPLEGDTDDSPKGIV